MAVALEFFEVQMRPARPPRSYELRDANARAVPCNPMPARVVSLWEEMPSLPQSPKRSGELLAFADDLKAYAELAGRRDAVRRWRGLPPYESD